MKELNEWAPRMLAKLLTVRGLVQVNSDQQDRGLLAGLVIDRTTASRLGITTQMIDDTLYDAFGQRQVSTLYTPLNQYHVVMEVDPRYWQNPDGLELFTCALLTVDKFPSALSPTMSPPIRRSRSRTRGNFHR